MEKIKIVKWIYARKAQYREYSADLWTPMVTAQQVVMEPMVILWLNEVEYGHGLDLWTLIVSAPMIE